MHTQIWSNYATLVKVYSGTLGGVFINMNLLKSHSLRLGLDILSPAHLSIKIKEDIDWIKIMAYNS